jgi:threonine dehydrogenase-like Zn-dependent dehydrogenase
MNSTWGGHAAVHTTPATGYAGAVKLPRGVDPLDYVLVELGAIAWRAVSMCVPAPGETAVVCGQGIIGALATLWLIKAGVRVIALDLDATRLEQARRMGALVVDGKSPDAAAQVLAYAGGLVDIAVEASASHAGARLVASLLRWPHAFNSSISYRPDEGPRLANYWPRLCFLASYTKTMELLPTGLANVEGAMVFYPRDRRVSDRQAVIDQIRSGVLKTADFVGTPVPYTEASEVYRSLRDEPAKALTQVISWE